MIWIKKGLTIFVFLLVIQLIFGTLDLWSVIIGEIAQTIYIYSWGFVDDESK